MIYNIEAVGIQIGSQIFKKREAKGWTQKELAKRCFLSEDSRQTVAAWEKGKKLPSFEQILELCNIFDCEITHFLGDDCTTRDLQFVHDMTGLSEKSIQSLNRYKDMPEFSHIVDLLDDLIQDRDNDGMQTLGKIASIAHALMALRETIPNSGLQADVNIAGLNWTCQNSFMQFIDRYTKI